MIVYYQKHKIGKAFIDFLDMKSNAKTLVTWSYNFHYLNQQLVFLILFHGLWKRKMGLVPPIRNIHDSRTEWHANGQVSSSLPENKQPLYTFYGRINIVILVDILPKCRKDTSHTSHIVALFKRSYTYELFWKVSLQNFPLWILGTFSPNQRACELILLILILEVFDLTGKRFQCISNKVRPQGVLIVAFGTWSRKERKAHAGGQLLQHHYHIYVATIKNSLSSMMCYNTACSFLMSTLKAMKCL